MIEITNHKLVWEQVFEAREIMSGFYRSTAMAKVAGGHLYSEAFKENGKIVSATMCFVPDVDLTRYQAHLRDAYKQGFIDGGVDAHAQYQKAAT